MNSATTPICAQAARSKSISKTDGPANAGESVVLRSNGSAELAKLIFDTGHLSRHTQPAPGQNRPARAASTGHGPANKRSHYRPKHHRRHPREAVMVLVKFAVNGNIADQRGHTLRLGLQNRIVKSFGAGGEQRGLERRYSNSCACGIASINCTCSGRVTGDACVAPGATEARPPNDTQHPATEANGAAAGRRPETGPADSCSRHGEPGPTGPRSPGSAPADAGS